MAGYQDLQVYVKSYAAALAVYEMAKGYPKEERYAMTDQIRRAALSIPLNIAEGYGKRSSQAEFRRFLLMAIGSSDEVNVLLDFAKDLGYICESEYSEKKKKYEEVGKMLNSLIHRVGSKSSI